MASEGPQSAGGGANDAGFGIVAWTNPGNITASDNTRATAVVNLGSPTTQYNKSSSHGHAIPAGATIDGILVEWEKSASLSGSTSDARSRAVKGGTVGSTDKADATAWPLTAAEAYTSYGGATDLWGTTWTDSDINASGFGAAIAAQCTASRTMNLDHCRTTVYYTAAAAGSPFIKFLSNIPGAKPGALFLGRQWIWRWPAGTRRGRFARRVLCAIRLFEQGQETRYATRFESVPLDEGEAPAAAPAVSREERPRPLEVSHGVY